MEETYANVGGGDDDDGHVVAASPSQPPTHPPCLTKQQPSSQRLEALYHWLFSFPQLASSHPDNHHCNSNSNSIGLLEESSSASGASSIEWLTDIEISNAIVQIANEICINSETIPTNNSNDTNNSTVVVARRTTAKEAWEDIQSILNNANLLLCYHHILSIYYR